MMGGLPLRSVQNLGGGPKPIFFGVEIYRNLILAELGQMGLFYDTMHGGPAKEQKKVIEDRVLYSVIYSIPMLALRIFLVANL